MDFKQWLENIDQGILQFGQELSIKPQSPILVSFDFDGTLTRWIKDQRGWHEAPFIQVIRRLKDWASKGHHCIITTHRTKELEGNPAFADPTRLKMQIKDIVEDDVLPLGGNDIFFTHMGDKGTALKDLAIRLKVPMALHYDDEMKNLQSVLNAGLVPVQVNPGPSPPKYVVAGDGQTPTPATAPTTPKV